MLGMGRLDRILQDYSDTVLYYCLENSAIWEKYHSLRGAPPGIH